MRFKHLRPMLWTERLTDTISFYTEKLGFTCADHNEEWGWAALQKDDIEIMLCAPNAHMPFDRPVFTGSLYILTENVEELWESLKDVASLVYPMEDFDYGMREFAIYDNNGYILQFGEELA